MAVVLSIVPYTFLPAKTGGQKNIALFNKYFSRHQTVFCSTLKDNNNELADGYECIPLFSPSKLRYVNVLNFFRLKRLIQEKKATHLLIEHPYFGWLAMLLKQTTGVKLIVHSHNIEGIRFRTLGKWWWRLLWKYERIVHRNADYNLFITDEDKRYAIEQFGLLRKKCMVATYGIEWNRPPSQDERAQAKKYVTTKYRITNERLLVFAGSFNYKPNRDAFRIIDEKICPLLDSSNIPYKVLICGPYLETNTVAHRNIIITGFVDDIHTYFKAADVFINPVMEGGGIKTKLVEALGNNTNAVSTIEGSIGVNQTLCNGKLFVTANNDWDAFASRIVEAIDFSSNILDDFYQQFYWQNIAQRAAKFIETNA